MTKLQKWLPVFYALSAVVIIAGIVLFALLGFNHATERPERYVFEVDYDIVVTIENKEDALASACEDAFAAQGLSYAEKATVDVVSADSLTETADRVLRYTFGGDVSAESLAKAAEAVRAAVSADDTYGIAQIAVGYHALETHTFSEEAWRGAVAIALGVVVALIYLGVRYGVASAVGGLVSAAHGAFLTVCLFALTRIPVAYYAPLLYGAVAAFACVLLWTVACFGMKENFRTPEYTGLSAGEAVVRSVESSKKAILLTALALAAVIAVVGVVAATGVMLLVLPALVSVAAALYSVFLVAPAACAPVKKRIDRFKSRKNRGYEGKKKADPGLE